MRGTSCVEKTVPFKAVEGMVLSQEKINEILNSGCIIDLGSNQLKVEENSLAVVSKELIANGS